MASRPRPIPTPLRQHWRRVRYQLVPVLAFAASVLAVAALWRHQAGVSRTVGEVAAVRIPVRCQYPGQLSRLARPVELFQRVEKEMVVARVEDKAVESALAALATDVEALQAEVEAARARLERDQAERGYDRLLETRRLALDVERTELVILDLQTEMATEKARLERYNRLLARAEELRQTDASSPQMVVDLTLERDRSEAVIRGTGKRIEQAKANLQAARERFKEHPDAQPLQVDPYLEPIRKRRDAQAKRVQELRLHLAAMTLRAPESGTVCAILREPGQAVRAGDEILVIAPDRQAYIVAYVRQEERVRPKVDMKVAVRSRTSPDRAGQGQVLKVGPQFEEVPPHQRRDPTRPEWGRPVTISMPPQMHLAPGELVDVVFASS